VTVLAAHSANPLKLERMRGLGADVRPAGDDFDAAKIAARAYAERVVSSSWRTAPSQPSLKAPVPWPSNWPPGPSLG